MRCFRQSFLVLVTAVRPLTLTNRFLVSNINSTSQRSSKEVESFDKDNIRSGEGSNALPGLELARQAVGPIQFSSTKNNEDESVSSFDPLIYWREYYSLEHAKPYYHNIQTNETTFQIPKGFPTQFPLYYSKNGFNVDGHGVVHHLSKSTTTEGNGNGSNTQNGSSGLSLRQKLAAYGAGGVLLYLIIHNISFVVVFTCIYFFHMDLPGLARSYGFNISDKKNDTVEGKKNERSPFLRTLLLSIVLNKILIPFHLALTIGAAPFLVHRLEPIAMRFIPRSKSFFVISKKPTSV
ncbi:unnamed protein product [Phytomonas sp. Hart1]|nr:unnamed protein product [Phytomonas sp. Hart1]|eukprot:CCW70544.1 unnamed protein product [Phytomonas sp. isolate Hart1]